MEIKENHSLKPLTWMKVGGAAKYYAEVKEKNDLIEAFRFASEKKLPVVYLGQGSNIVLPDEGIDGMVLRLMNQAVEYDLFYSETEALLHVEAGMVLARLIRDCRRKELSGLDNFVGIPGTVGSAVRGNIGIPEEEFGDIVHQVTLFNGSEFFTLHAEECDFRYRGSLIKDEYWLVWSVDLLVRKGTPPHKDEWLLERVAKQPKGNSCGSFFKNPDPKNGLYAGKLIEECGLKGMQIGGAFISEKHANFLMTDGNAKSSDVLELARFVRKTVQEQKGVLLENEVLLYDKKGKLVDL